jgi:monoamine oxidase
MRADCSLMQSPISCRRLFVAAELVLSLKDSFNCCVCSSVSPLPQVSAVAGGAAVTFYAKAAIVAVPLGVLKKRGPAFFSPALETAKQDAINCLGMSLLNKVILEFPTSYAGSVFFEWGWWHNRLPNATGDT